MLAVHVQCLVELGFFSRDALGFFNLFIFALEELPLFLFCIT